MTSELRVDNLKGSTTGGSISVLGEGTSATTNLQQGLCKAWINLDGGSVDSGADLDGVRDSFNVASLVDNGTGTYTVNFSNAMSSTSYTASGLIALENDAGSFNPLSVANRATASCRIDCENNSSSNSDPVAVDTQIFGDLA